LSEILADILAGFFDVEIKSIFDHLIFQRTQVYFQNSPYHGGINSIIGVDQPVTKSNNFTGIIRTFFRMKELNINLAQQLVGPFLGEYYNCM